MSIVSTFLVKRNVGQIDPRGSTDVDNADMASMKERGARLRRLRDERDLDQAEVADAVGIARSTLSGIENGKANPGRQTLEALATFYNKTLDFITGDAFFGEDDIPTNGRGLNPIDDSIQQANEIAAISRAWKHLTPAERNGIMAIVIGLVEPRSKSA